MVMLLGACAEVSRILLGQINVFTARSGAAVIGGFACIAVWYVSHSYFGATIVRYSGDALGLLEAASRAVVTPLHSGGLRASSITSGTRARAQDALLPHPQPALLRAPYIHNSNVSHSAVGHSLNTGAVTPGTFGMSWQYGSSALGLAIVVFLSVVHVSATYWCCVCAAVLLSSARPLIVSVLTKCQMRLFFFAVAGTSLHCATVQASTTIKCFWVERGCLAPPMEQNC